MAVLALKEFDKITCGDAFNPISRVVRDDQYRALERFSEEYQKVNKVTVFQHGPRRT